MERSVLLKGPPLLAVLLLALQTRFSSQAEQEHWVRGPLRLALTYVMHIHALVTSDRSALLEDLRLMAAVLFSIDLHICAVPPAPAGGAVLLRDPGLHARSACQGSVVGNLHLYSPPDTLDDAWEEITLATEKIHAYAEVFCCTEEWEELWRATERAASDVHAAFADRASTVMFEADF